MKIFIKINEFLEFLWVQCLRIGLKSWVNPALYGYIKRKVEMTRRSSAVSCLGPKEKVIVPEKEGGMS